MIEEKALSVSQITRQITGVLSDNFDNIRVTGEISNFKQHSSGHRYFTLKDEGASISCVMWRSRTLNIQPTDGMKVTVSGRISVYAPRGSYQIDCDTMSALGQGDLFLAFEELKKKLSDSGYFEADRKKPLPDLPLKIGVSTSPTGAAVKDIMSTIERRFPAAEIYFRPTLVQGDGAAEDIVAAISDLIAEDVDIIVIGRGGGSLEDLWAYNMEITAMAIVDCPIPIISAVGHETDFTIADFVADIRAATPTAAGEIVTPLPKENILNAVDNFEFQMKKDIQRKIDDIRDNTENLISDRIRSRLMEKISVYWQYSDESESRVKNSIERIFNKRNDQLRSLQKHLKTLYPLTPLAKGFALLKTGDEIILRDDTLGNYLEIEIVRAKESAFAGINRIIPKENLNQK